MLVTQQEIFQPVTIVFDTPEELAAVVSALEEAAVMLVRKDKHGTREHTVRLLQELRRFCPYHTRIG